MQDDLGPGLQVDGSDGKRRGEPFEGARERRRRRTEEGIPAEHTARDEPSRKPESARDLRDLSCTQAVRT